MIFRNYFFLVILILPAAQPAWADTREAEAREAFTQGTEAYRNALFDEALLFFEDAYRLRPSYKLQYNIAQTQLELKRPHLALDAFERYLVEGNEKIEADRREDVLKEILRLRRMVGEIIVMGKTGTECRIDDEHVGFLPLDRPVRLKSGTHEIKIYLHGEVMCQKSVEIVAAKKRIEQCRTQSEQQEGPEPESAWDVMNDTTVGEFDIGIELARPTATEESHFLKVAPWVMSGLAVATMTTGTILALKTSSLNSELNGACDGGVCDSGRREDVNVLPKLAMGSDILFVATSVLTATAIALFVVKARRRHPEHPVRNSRPLEEQMSVHESNPQKRKL